jgi:hypothetical protein
MSFCECHWTRSRGHGLLYGKGNTQRSGTRASWPHPGTVIAVTTAVKVVIISKLGRKVVVVMTVMGSNVVLKIGSNGSKRTDIHMSNGVILDK